MEMEKAPATVNMLEEKDVIRHFRHLNNLNELIDYDDEMDKFVRQLLEFGWSLTKIADFKVKGAQFTNYDKEIGRPL